MAFCHARDALRRAQHSAKDELSERREAAKALGGMLRESMEKHGVPCMPVPVAQDGAAQYVRLVPGVRRSCSLRTDEDALALVEDVARHVEHVPAEELPGAVAALVRARARERGPPPGPPRVVLAKHAARVPKSKEDAFAASDTPIPAVLPAETQRLAGEFVQAQKERAAVAAPVRAARVEYKAAEQALLPALSAPATVRVQRPGQAAAQTLSVRRVDPPARPARLGVRMLLPLVREAAAQAAKHRGAGFDTALRETLASLLASRGDARPGPARLRVTR